MNWKMILTASTALFGVIGIAHGADPNFDFGNDDVDTCLRLLAEEALPQGKRSVSRQIRVVGLDREAVYAVTLFSGNSYEFATCSAKHITDLDLVLYDQEGKLVAAHTEIDRGPVLSHKPAITGTHYLVLTVHDTTNRRGGAVGYVQLYE
jgi:hypothetical protein